ncbi:hypothetical protein C8R46DRAFT_1226610 [Mycena filopes]|nr:hypothetical protein C8R46DRAFT_1226610 [Mycena filopes]
MRTFDSFPSGFSARQIPPLCRSGSLPSERSPSNWLMGKMILTRQLVLILLVSCAVVTRAAVFKLNAPTSPASGGKITVTWSSNISDNYLNGPLALANDISSQSHHVVLVLPKIIPGPGYVLALLNSNSTEILTQSPPFTIADDGPEHVWLWTETISRTVVPSRVVHTAPSASLNSTLAWSPPPVFTSAIPPKTSKPAQTHSSHSSNPSPASSRVSPHPTVIAYPQASGVGCSVCVPSLFASVVINTVILLFM